MEVVRKTVPTTINPPTPFRLSQILFANQSVFTVIRSLNFSTKINVHIKLMHVVFAILITVDSCQHPNDAHTHTARDHST